MEWGRYKQLCDQPNVLSRWLLEQTQELAGQADSSIVPLLEATLQGTPLPKPLDQKEARATDMFTLTWSPRQVAVVVELVSSARARGTTTSATRLRGLGGFVEAWQEYATYLDERGAP